MMSCECSTGIWLVTIVEARPWRSSRISKDRVEFLRKVLVGEISLPVVRVEGSQKAAKGICTNGLAAYLDKQADAARVIGF